jgi:uncharacterized membrane protein YadS
MNYLRENNFDTSTKKIFLSMSMAAVGISINLNELKSMRYKPFVLGLVAALTVGLVGILSIEFYINFLN